MGMDRRWIRRGLLVLAAVAGAVIATTALLRRRSEHLGPDGVVESHSPSRSGTPDDRGEVPALGIDVERLRETDELAPTVEYLTYIQDKRGTAESLLFVRHEDLDALAALEGDELPSFLERLQHLGVVISNN